VDRTRRRGYDDDDDDDDGDDDALWDMAKCRDLYDVRMFHQTANGPIFFQWEKLNMETSKKNTRREIHVR
jgi:hypothetical protein